MAMGDIAFDLIARDKATTTFSKVGRSADNTGSKFAKMGKIAKFGALGIAGGAALAGKALFDMSKNAMEDAAGQRRLAVALRNTTGATKGQTKAVEGWISKQGVALGVTDDELRPAFQRLVQATGNISKAQKLAGVAMDASAGSGKSLKVVTEAIAKAQSGNMGALSKLGVKIKDADGKTLSFDKAMQGMAKTFKGQASAAANTASGKFDRLKLIMDETKESIGAKMIPISEKAADFLLNDFGPAAEKAGGWFKDNLLPPLKDIGNFIKDRVIPAAKELGEKVLKGLRGFIDNVSKSMKDNKPFLDALKDGFKNVAEFVMKKVVPAIGWVIEKILPLLGTGIGGAITNLKNFASGFLNMATFGVKAFRFLLNAALTTFGGILSAAVKGLGWIPGIGGKIKKAEKAFTEFKDSTITALDKTATALQRTKDKVDGIPSKKDIKINVDAAEAFVKLAGIKAALANQPKGPPGATAPRTGGGSNPRLSSGRASGRSSGGDTLVVQLVMPDGRVIQEQLLKLKRQTGTTLGIA